MVVVDGGKIPGPKLQLEVLQRQTAILLKLLLVVAAVSVEQG